MVPHFATTPYRASRQRYSTALSPSAPDVLKADLDIVHMLKNQRLLEKQLREVKEEVEIAEQARKIESGKKTPGGQVDGEMVDLIAKWKGASRRAADEMFGSVKDRVNR